MTSPHPRLARAVRAFLGLALAGLTLAIVANTASASDKQHGSQRLVVRGDATVTDFLCNAGVCPLEFAGTFRGAPVGTGAYAGSIKLNVNEAFSNGEGGVCAPIEGHFTLGAGTPDRLVLALYGDSCQDGAGDPRSSSFTGVAHFVVKSGTGAYAKTRGGGLASFSEDAADHDRMTVIGRITR